MSGTIFELEDYIVPDHLGTQIARQWIEWNTFRNPKETAWKEVQQYVYATDTTQTTNSKLPWNNKTTIPKLCQIRDNLYANYLATMFPKRKWLIWEGDTKNDDDREKSEVIESYIEWVIERTDFKKEIAKLVLDYIDYGNCFATVEWVDQTVHIEEELGRTQVGYVGPMIRRINPVDILMNPLAPTFEESPKIVRSFVSLGEVKKILQAEGNTAEERESAQEIYDYLRNYRSAMRSTWGQGDLTFKDNIYQVAGFNDFRSYLASNYVELLTLSGNVYNEETDEYLENHIIQVVDRHKVISKRPNPSTFGHPPIYHTGWRVRQDNLWAMGPLDNLVGMQYRIDHLENLKADVFDLIAFPPLKIKGYVEDFEWAPFAQIVVGDDGDVDTLSPDVQALNADMQIAILEQKMEEMAGAPKEAMGFRTPGEKTMYEVQRLENAAARIFQNKVSQFEQTMVEPLLNAMLEMARRNLSSQTIRVFDTEYEVVKFRDLTADDITGNGRIRPLAAQHFAERANQIQNITNFFQTLITADPDLKMHFSSIRMAKLAEDLLDLGSQDMVEPYIRITEQTEAQRLATTQNQQLNREGGGPPNAQTGSPDDLAQSPDESEGQGIF
jgi:uncharacterized protein YukE